LQSAKEVLPKESLSLQIASLGSVRNDKEKMGNIHFPPAFHLFIGSFTYRFIGAFAKLLNDLSTLSLLSSFPLASQVKRWYNNIGFDVHS